MSKSNNYQNYYKNPKNEEVVNESVNAQTEEIQPVELEKTTAKETEQIKEVPQPKRAKVAGAKLVNMRENPNKSATVIDKLKEGTIVELGESTVVGPEWSHIKYGNKTGFMMSMFLKEI